MKQIIIFILIISNVGIVKSQVDSTALNLKMTKLEVSVDSLDKKVIELTNNETISNQELIIEKVSGFYEIAWNKLIIFLTIIGGIVLFVAPYLFSKYQRNQFEKSIMDLKSSYNIEIKNTKEEIIDEAKGLVRDELELGKKELDEKIDVVQAMSYYLQGRILMESNPIASLVSFLNSIRCQVFSNSFTNFQNTLDNMAGMFIDEHRKDEELMETFKEVIDLLGENNSNGTLSSQIKVLKDIIK